MSVRCLNAHGHLGIVWLVWILPHGFFHGHKHYRNSTETVNHGQEKWQMWVWFNICWTSETETYFWVFYYWWLQTKQEEAILCRLNLQLNLCTTRVFATDLPWHADSYCILTAKIFKLEYFHSSFEMYAASRRAILWELLPTCWQQCQGFAARNVHELVWDWLMVYWLQYIKMLSCTTVDLLTTCPRLSQWHIWHMSSKVSMLAGNSVCNIVHQPVRGIAASMKKEIHKHACSVHLGLLEGKAH